MGRSFRVVASVDTPALCDAGEHALSLADGAGDMNSAERERRDYLKAIGLTVVGFSLVPGMDAIAKHLSGEYSVLQIGWARFVFHLLFVVPIVLLRHRSEIWPTLPWLQFARGIFQMSATLLFFAALSHMPIADALALLFAYPLLVTALSPVLLGEHVRGSQWLAIGVGFVGVLFILRPGAGAFDGAGIFALVASVCFALYMIATRKVAGTSPPLVTLIYSAIVGAVLLTLGLPWYWTPPSASDWALMILIGFIAACGHFAIVKAFELAPASRLAPFGYIEIVSATTLGYVVFGDFPDAWAFVGVGIIILAGVMVSYKSSSEAA
jgi:drug/metabolite transporter (DMT)-like permease